MAHILFYMAKLNPNLIHWRTYNSNWQETFVEYECYFSETWLIFSHSLYSSKAEANCKGPAPVFTDASGGRSLSREPSARLCYICRSAL